MIDFSGWLNLPMIWGVLIATAVFLYVVLDGFDLGCGILFPFAPTDDCRDRLMNSIAPFWDGNETWLVLGGGGLFVAFPLAYSILLPALYLPIMLMLMGLIFRGVAFEFRFKSDGKDRKLWDVAFHAGSLLATFMQGVILGNFVQGFAVTERSFSGGAMDWANGFSLGVGVALIFGYALLGATWLIMKTDGETQAWARRVARYVKAYVALAMALVGLATIYVDRFILDIWFVSPNIYFFSLLPVLAMLTFIVLWRDLNDTRREVRPFLLSLALFFLSYLGFCASFYPWIVPFTFTLADAAAVSTSQTITLIGAVIMLPIILAYTGYCYYIFRGKTSSENYY